MVEAPNQIVFQQLGLGSVLKQYRLFVPPNQREYAWTDDEVMQLFRDFAKAIADDEPGYFLGTIVTIPRSDGALEVVDGQQRLATTAILLASIRDYLTGKEDMLVEAINNDFLTGIDRTRRARIPKLRLNIDDNEHFAWIVARSSDDTVPHQAKTSHALLHQARDQARRYVRTIVSTVAELDHGDILNNWVSFIERRALVILLQVSNDANAYKMFETLNDRGLRTSQADLIKNYLFSRAGDRIQEVQSRWNYLRGVLESIEERDITVDFLRHSLIAIRGHTRESQIYDAVQERVRGENAAVAFTSTLETLAGSYVATFNSELEMWNGYPDAARHAIEVLNLLNVRPMRPLLLAVATRFTREDATAAFQFAVALGVRLLIASSTRTGSVELPLANVAHAVFSGDLETVRDLKARLNGVTPGDEEFRAAFETARVSKAQLARYYLRSLEMAASGEREPWFIPTQDRSIINLEHVLPKRPEGNWPQFTADEAAMYVNRLGNQALLQARPNSDLRSSGFLDKKRIYQQSPYLLTNMLGQLPDWSPTEISERQRQFAQWALRAWPI